MTLSGINSPKFFTIAFWLTSFKGCSKVGAAKPFEHPLKEVNQNEIVKNFGDFTPDSVTVEDLGEKNSLAIKLMKDAGWN